MADLQAVLFDFDFTLGDSSAGIVESVTFALSQAGFPVPSRDRILATIGLSLEAVFHDLTGDASTAAAREFAIRFHERAEDVMEAATVVYPSVPEVVERLRRGGLRTGIVTTKRRARVGNILTRNGLRDAFDVLVGADDVTVLKPDPSGIALALGELGASPCAAVYVGDHVVDAVAARAAGVRFIATVSGTSSRVALAQYPHTAIVDGIADVPTALGLAT